MDYILVQLVEGGTHQSAYPILALGLDMGNYTTNLLSSSMAYPTRANSSRISILFAPTLDAVYPLRDDNTGISNSI